MKITLSLFAALLTALSVGCVSNNSRIQQIRPVFPNNYKVGAYVTDQTHSMGDWAKGGRWVTLDPMPYHEAVSKGFIKEGIIIEYWAPSWSFNPKVAHRIVGRGPDDAKGNPQWVMKGDANKNADPTLLNAENYLAIVDDSP